MAPGATLGDLDRATEPHGLAVPIGVVSGTGVAGLTLGGGIGWLTHAYGLTIDNLLAVDVVTARATVRRARRENADLFWGLRAAAATSASSRRSRSGPMRSALTSSPGRSSRGPTAGRRRCAASNVVARRDPGRDDHHRHVHDAAAGVGARRRAGDAHRLHLGVTGSCRPANGWWTAATATPRTSRPSSPMSGRRGSRRPTGCFQRASARTGRTPRSTGSTTRRSSPRAPRPRADVGRHRLRHPPHGWRVRSRSRGRDAVPGPSARTGSTSTATGPSRRRRRQDRLRQGLRGRDGTACDRRPVRQLPAARRGRREARGEALAVYGRRSSSGSWPSSARFDPDNLFRLNHNIPPG